MKIMKCLECKKLFFVVAGTDKAKSFNDAFIIIVIANCGGR